MERSGRSLDGTAPRGRGSADNPPNRFIPLHYAPDPDCPPDDAPAPHTQFLRDATRTIIASNDSPDVGFTHSVNPYRGCEHGCVYCYARPFHEYLGLSAGLDFETKIMVKEDAPALLRRELMAKSWVPTTLSFSGVTDCYQPIERKLKLTRRCLEVLRRVPQPGRHRHQEPPGDPRRRRARRPGPRPCRRRFRVDHDAGRRPRGPIGAAGEPAGGPVGGRRSRSPGPACRSA